MGTVISAEMVKDTINIETGKRLTTMLWTFPRMILSEVNTHRKMSGNTSSSRAISIDRLIHTVEHDPFIPTVWTKNEPGMQGYETLDGVAALQAAFEWKMASESALQAAAKLQKLGLHKQIVNRVLEPFMWCKKLVSFTEFNNFLNQRNHPAAEPHMRILARAVQAAIQESYPEYKASGEWHIPFDLGEGSSLEDRLVFSTACAAHTSYTVVGEDKPMTLDKAHVIYAKLVEGDPVHASPFEHCAIALARSRPAVSRNFDTWGQLRHFIEKGVNVAALDGFQFEERIGA